MDALAVQSTEGPRIFTLQGADQGYRTLIEEMNEGALLLSRRRHGAVLQRLPGRPAGPPPERADRQQFR